MEQMDRLVAIQMVIQARLDALANAWRLLGSFFIVWK